MKVNFVKMSLLQIIRNILKGVKIRGYRSIFLANTARLGQYSRVLAPTFTLKDSSTAAINLGNNVSIGSFTELQVWDGNVMVIKEQSSINDNCKILGDVLIEKYCLFSANIFASSGNHYASVNPTWLIKDQDSFVLLDEERQKNHSRKIHFEEDCWIGYGAFVKQGIHIGRGAIVGAYTIVTKDIPPYSVQIGSPNKEIKKRVNFSPPLEINCLTDSDLPYFYRGFGHNRSELKISRNANIIYSDAESIVTLAKLDAMKCLHISGKNLCFPNIIQMTLYFNESHYWKVDIASEKFDLSFNMIEGILTIENILPERVGADLVQYSVIRIASSVIKSNQHKYCFGISQVKLT